MTRNDTTRTLAAIACTLMTSATCLVAALAPAQSAAPSPVSIAQQKA